MSDLLKKGGDTPKYPDDNWREILHANGFTPSGVKEEVWRSPHSDIKVRIDVDRMTEEPYYQVIAEDGTRSAKWTDAEALKSIVEPREPEPPRLSPEDEKKGDDDFLKSMGIIGHQRTSKKLAGRPPRFSFAVPMKAAGAVAFHLAKAGMKDFEVTHYEEEDYSLFEFPTEPEMHVAEEIVKSEYADQIRAQKGLWGMWSDKSQGPGAVEGFRQAPYVASVEQDFAWEARSQGKFAGQWGDKSYDSDSVHDILDKHRPKDPRGKGFDEPVPAGQLASILKELDGMSGGDDPDRYLGVVVFLVTHGSKVPGVYRERARQIAFALVQDEEYLGEWQNPDLRRVELENEIELLEGPSKTGAEDQRPEITDEDLPEGFFSDKTFEEQRREKGEPPWEPYKFLPSLRPTAALYEPQPPAPNMTDVELKRMETYRRKKLVAWLSEMGLSDAQGNSDTLAEYDAGDFHKKDDIYEEVRGWIKEERRDQSAYRRLMRGKR